MFFNLDVGNYYLIEILSPFKCRFGQQPVKTWPCSLLNSNYKSKTELFHF